MRRDGGDTAGKTDHPPIEHIWPRPEVKRHFHQSLPDGIVALAVISGPVHLAATFPAFSPAFRQPKISPSRIFVDAFV
jgi:hypothetical protein